MRFSLIAGTICIVLGGLVFFRLATYTDKHEIVRVGDVSVTDKDHRPVPLWVGVCFTVAGVGLVAQGLTAKRSTS